MKKLLSLLTLTAAALVAAPAMAAGAGWYAGAGLGHSALNGLSSADNGGTSGAAYVGMKVSPRVAAEFGVSRLGDITVDGARSRPEMASLQGVVSTPVGHGASVFAKGGVAYTHLRGDVSGTRFAPVVGVGAEYALTRTTSAVAQVQYVHNFADSGTNLVNTSLGLQYRF
jgi:hypothetical protein